VWATEISTLSRPTTPTHPLYHSTDEAGKIGIETKGFGLSHTAEFPEASWFCAHKDPLIGSSVGWWVIVEMPDDVAAAHQFEAFHFVPSHFQLSDVEFFLIPWNVVNRYRPFQFERHDN
jgi:hypothetical protein